MAEVELLKPVRLFDVPMKIPYSSAAVHMARVKLSEALVDAGYRQWRVHFVHESRSVEGGCVVPIVIKFDTTLAPEHDEELQNRLDKQLMGHPKLGVWMDPIFHKVQN